MDLDQTNLPIDAVEFIPERAPAPPRLVGAEGGFQLDLDATGKGDLVLQHLVAYAAAHGVELPRDTRRILRWAHATKQLVPWPEVGMLVILRMHQTQFYWCGIVADVAPAAMTVAFAQPMIAREETKITLDHASNRGFLLRDDAWHVVGYIRI